MGRCTIEVGKKGGIRLLLLDGVQHDQQSITSRARGRNQGREQKEHEAQKRPHLDEELS